jgi:hypothetical protein
LENKEKPRILKPALKVTKVIEPVEEFAIKSNLIDELLPPIPKSSPILKDVIYLAPNTEQKQLATKPISPVFHSDKHAPITPTGFISPAPMQLQTQESNGLTPLSFKLTDSTPSGFKQMIILPKKKVVPGIKKKIIPLGKIKFKVGGSKFKAT